MLADGTAAPVDGSSSAGEDMVVLHPSAGVAVLMLLGEHDMLREKELRARLLALVPAHPLVVVDVSHARFIDSSCLHNLLAARKHARSLQHRVVIQMGHDATVKRLLEVSGLFSALECVATRAQALGVAAP